MRMAKGLALVQQAIVRSLQIAKGLVDAWRG